LAVDAPARRFAAPTVSSSVPAPAAGLLQVTLSLIVVLAAVFAVAWVLRRYRALGGKTEAGAAITVIAERAVGPRERVVLLQVGSDRVLVGVAAGSVRALHVCAGSPAAGFEVTPR
jgi:flagellar protein FliO/FliZ